MKPEKIEINVSGQVTTWIPGEEPPSSLVVKESQILTLTLIFPSEHSSEQAPLVFVEDHTVSLRLVRETNEGVCFTSSPEKAFRESFGHAFIRVVADDVEYRYPVEVLATKVTASQAEKMIRYLASHREEIIRVCLSRTKRLAGVSDAGRADPEMVLTAAERVLQLMVGHRGDFQRLLRNKLTPEKVPAWKAERAGGQIDPVDVIFNLDALRPCLGGGDIHLHGKSYSAQAIDTTMLRHEFNVEENHILLGSLYSIRIRIARLMSEIDGMFKNQKISNFDREYVSIGEMMIKFTGGAMYDRCQRVVETAENLIAQIEDDLGVEFRGEIFPKITPYVRASRFYRSVYEQIAAWFNLGAPTLEGSHFLVKLRSLSKIFEFFVLFRLFEYLVARGWSLDRAEVGEEFEAMIPKLLVFSRNGVTATLLYEKETFKFNRHTSHMDLVKLPHRDFPGNHWCPDYILRFDCASQTRYMILDAKYSNSFSVDRYSIPLLTDKYYNHQSVFDQSLNALSRNQILAVLAVFPEFLDQVPNPIGARLDKLGGKGDKPVQLPMLSGLPISFRTDSVLEKCMDRAIDLTLSTLGVEEGEVVSVA